MNNDKDILQFFVERASDMPREIRQKFVQYGPESSESRILMLRTPSKEKATLVAEVLNSVEESYSSVEKELANSRIDKLVKSYMAAQPVSEVNRNIEHDNAVLRARYLSTTNCLISSELNERVDPSSWISEKRVFAVSHSNIDYYPAFQFRGEEPKNIIESVLRTLPSDMSSWQVAFWFAAENVWLDGKSPELRLDDESDILVAAEREGDAIIG